jgi:hypothetical protein
MGLDLSYVTQKDRIDVRPSKTDWDILMYMGKSYPEQVELVCGVDDFGSPRQESRHALLEAIEVIMYRLDAEADKLPYVYVYRFVGGILDGQSGSGMTSGLQIGRDGFYYSIQGGLAECWMIKQAVGADGRGTDVERRDVRDVRSIHTDNLGEIVITRKKKASTLKEILQQLKNFLARSSDESVTKIMG